MRWIALGRSRAKGAWGKYPCPSWMTRHTAAFLRTGVLRTEGIWGGKTVLPGSAVLHSVPVADRKVVEHIVVVDCSSHGRRRLLVSRGVQLEEGAQVVRHSLVEEVVVEHRVDMESDFEGQLEDMGIEVLVVLGCSHSYSPAGEHEEDEAE